MRHYTTDWSIDHKTFSRYPLALYIGDITARLILTVSTKNHY